MKKKANLTVQLSITMMLLVAGIIFFCIVFNIFFLEDYYAYNKQKELLSAYTELNNANNAGLLAKEEYDVTFEKICATGNLSILVETANQSLIRSSMRNEQLFEMKLEDMLFGRGQKDTKILVSEDLYLIIRETDSRMNSDYLTLVGYLDDGGYIYIRTALESIQESATITNKFFTIVGIGMLIASISVIIFLSQNISRPIKDLTTISTRMSNLDFEAKYQNKYHTSSEIEELGMHMNELSEALEQTISELKVANNELKVDIRKKEQIDEMRKEFLSNVSHELKTPLALIGGYAEGLKECINEDSDSRDFYCDVILDETNKMSRMVKQLLSLNQLEFGNDVVEMTRFDITELIRGVLNANLLLIEQNQIQIQFDETSPFYVWGDAFKIEEVVTNYLTNAIHHAEGEKIIRISYEQREELLRVNVFNTGKTIPEEALDQVWIKFYKVDKARTREYGGSGIGLSIVKAIMDSMHQECGVYNQEDGVIFWMELDAKN